MKTFFFVPKQNISDDSTRDIFEEYGNAFKKADIPNVELVSFDRIQFFLSDTIKDIQEESLFMVPSILDSFNAFSYGGVELALKIYFHYASAKNNKFQIIVLGTEEEYAFWEHCRYSSILKCPHVGFIQNNIYSIQNYLLKVEPIDWNIDWDECIERLKRLNVSKPASYKTHHSITNEWSIYRWSKYLSIENIAIQKDIEEFLYFNYLKAIYPESKIDNPKSFLIAEKGKVLLIDDEVGKGWHTFFKSFLSFSHSVTFDSIGSNFKNLSKEDIIAQTEAKIKEFDPDVVLLDLRLHDTDFEDKSPSELTGAKVFEKIKNYNKGIQIVIFSASNKVWNYLPFASDGVILKESPELSVRDNYTQECIKNMLETLRISLGKGCFLSKLFRDVESIKANLPNNDFGSSISKQFDLSFLLISKAETEEQFAFAYVALYQIIEIITDELITKEQLQSNPVINKWKLSDGTYIREYKWDSQNKLYQDLGEAQSGKEPFPQWKKMAGLVFQKWAIPNGDGFVHNLGFLIEKRNGFIHNDKTILDKQDKITGKYLNHDIFDKSGFKSLFDSIKTICLHL